MMTTWDMMKRFNLPMPGSRVVFSRVPGASYASTGEVYQVGWGHGRYSSTYVSITRISPESSSGTYDGMTAWQYAEWEYDYTTVDNPHLKWSRP